MTSRKKSSHRAVLLHFHDDGQVCPQSLGQTCPHGGMDAATFQQASPSFLKNLPNGFTFPNLNGLAGAGLGGAAGLAAAGLGGAGLGLLAGSQDPGTAIKQAVMMQALAASAAAASGGGGDGGGGGAGAGAFGGLLGGMLGGGLGEALGLGGGLGASPLGLLAAQDPEMALMLAASGAVSGGTGGLGDATGMDSILFNNDLTNSSTSGGLNEFSYTTSLPDFVQDVSPNSLAVPGSSASNLGVAAMAKSAIESGTPSAIAALAKMAAASGNIVAAQALAKVSQMAASNGLRHIPPSAIMQIMAKTGLGGPAGLQAALQAAKEVEKTITPDKMDQAEKYQALMVKNSATEQIKQAFASSSLSTLSDAETKLMTEGKFATTEEFMEYMQNPDTDVSRALSLYFFLLDMYYIWVLVIK